MRKTIKYFTRIFAGSEKGQIMGLVLIFLLLSIFFIVPLLSYMGTAVKTGQTYQNNTDELYAADAGIDDGIWQIKYDNIPASYNYDYVNTWNYALTEPVNDDNVNVSISNLWVVQSIDPPPSISTAEDIINTQKLVVTGSIADPVNHLYQININYFKEAADDPMPVSEIGVWLAPGYTYWKDGTHQSNLESFPYNIVPVNSFYNGGQVVTWSLPTGTLFTDLPGVDTGVLPLATTITFYYHGTEDPSAVAWVITDSTTVPPFSWDADRKVYHINSVSGGTQVDSYVAKNEARKLHAAIPGDYYATGNSLLTWDGNTSHRYNSIWNNSSTATVEPSNLPDNSQILAAYLYWSGWKNEDKKGLTSGNSDNYLLNDACNDFNNWTAGSAWTENNRFEGHSTVLNSSSQRELTLSNYRDLSSFDDSPWVATASWDQWTSATVPGPTSQSSVPTADADTSANWGPTPGSPVTCFDKVDETTYNDSDYITGTSAGSGNQIILPTADGDTSGSWMAAPSSPATFFDKVDETTPDDSDYINSILSGSQTRFPSGDYSSSGTWSVYPTTPSTKWDKVDESTEDQDSTYIRLGTTAGYGLFSSSAFSVPTGATITNLTIGYVVKDNSNGSNNLRAAIRVNGTNYLTTDSGANPGNSYALRSYTFTNNPKTGATWTVADINGTGSNSLQAFGINSSDANPQIKITQVYAQVNYTVQNGYTLFSFTPPSIPVGSTVSNLTVYVRATDESSGSNDIRPSIKVNGSYYHATATSNDPGSSPTTYSYAYDQNPQTGAAWTAADVNGTGSNPLQQFGVYSSDLNPGVRISMVYAQVEYTGASNSGYKLFNFTPFSIPNGSTISDLTVYIRARDDSSGDNNIRPSIKVNGNYYHTTAPGNQPPGLGNFMTFDYSYNVNPLTGTAWTVADLNGTGPNPLQAFGVYSDDLSPGIRISMVYTEVNYTPLLVSISDADGLDYAFSGDNGASWSDRKTAFRGVVSDTQGSPNTVFQCAIDPLYLTNRFKIKFFLVGFSGSGQYCEVDNIRIAAMQPNNGIQFYINGTQYSLTDADIPQIGGDLVSKDAPPNRKGNQILNTFLISSTPNPYGFSYSCFRDVTNLVKNYSEGADLSDTDHLIYGNGRATYKVNDTQSQFVDLLDTNNSHSEAAYAGWSLIIIFNSPGVTGVSHQLYLYDDFIYSSQDRNNGVNIDFDRDGEPGGSISGFYVPEKDTGVISIAVNNGGNGYSSAPIVTITGGGGTGAAAIASIGTDGSVKGITLISEGEEYSSSPTVNLSGGGGTGAAATAFLDTNAAKITCFVGEGDRWYSGDYIAIKRTDGSLNTKLYDGIYLNSPNDDPDKQNSSTEPENVWNSQSVGLSSGGGVDIDTFYVPWGSPPDSGVLRPGDSSADLELYTYIDGWNMVYTILSFRSLAVTGGDLTYLIR